LFLEDQRDWFVLRSYNADQHRAVRGQTVALYSNRAGPRGRHLQDVVIPVGLAFEIFAIVKRFAVLAVGDVAVKDSLGACRE
jgi:hypothetical protein